MASTEGLARLLRSSSSPASEASSSGAGSGVVAAGRSGSEAHLGEPAAERGRSLLGAELRARIAGLALKARRSASSLLAGVHRSPHRGASVVFVEHREYRPGDDLRLLDWRAYARSDRHTVKRFEQETQLRATLVLDVSASMAYGEPITKHDYAATLLAALALVLVRQGDAAGACRIASELVSSVPPRARPSHLDQVLAELAVPGASGARTDLASALSSVAERAGRRGLVVIASDLLDLAPDALAPVEQLAHRGHEVWVFQVLHRDELELPFEGPTRFVGLEGESPIEVDPDALRARYREEIEGLIERCRARCMASGARHRVVRTDEPVERVLAELLAQPGHRAARR